MAQTFSEQIRALQGPALLSFGLGPFFLFGAIWAYGLLLLLLKSEIAV